ncbi:hypothetical protein [Streptomyces sp. NPDC002221]|uniref:hypothetical protein n=1 Tax=Streptomyces sp. NPDC002221 TaxID=3364639 RepID=UPI0036C77EF9
MLISTFGSRERVNSRPRALLAVTCPQAISARAVRCTAFSWSSFAGRVAQRRRRVSVATVPAQPTAASGASPVSSRAAVALRSAEAPARKASCFSRRVASVNSWLS